MKNEYCETLNGDEVMKVWRMGSCEKRSLYPIRSVIVVIRLSRVDICCIKLGLLITAYSSTKLLLTLIQYKYLHRSKTYNSLQRYDCRLIYKGYQKTLEETDLWKPSPRHLTRSTMPLLQTAWKKEMAKCHRFVF